MRITYSIKDVCDFIGSTTAKYQLPLFGRWCELDITSYSIGSYNDETRSIAISYGIRPLQQCDIRDHFGGGVVNGFFTIARGNAGNRQYLEQELTFPLITGSLLDMVCVSTSDIEFARNLLSEVLRGIESMIETVRQSIRAIFSDSVKNKAIRKLQDSYGKITSKTIKSILKELHWFLMLNKSGFTEQQLNCIVAMSKVNPPRYNHLDFIGDTDIPLAYGGEDIITYIRQTVQQARVDRLYRELQIERELNEKKLECSNRKAVSLLGQICGKKLANQFAEKGYITVEQDGFKFEIPANSFVRCTDPNGKKAQLCIHTQGFQVNAIDEVIIAYLYIKHKLSDYLRVAVLHGMERGFTRILA